jgi:two-component system NtrC family sensor kinase
MLDFYRTSLVEDEMRPTDVGALLNEVIALTEGDLRAAAIAPCARIAPGLRLQKGSRDKLKQVFLNLIANARDAMPDGGKLEIEAFALKGKITVAVRDTGTGISSENLDRIFDAFFTTKEKVSGVGLGLSVSYGIVTQHGGLIGVESAPGKGSTFTITLPEEV